MSVCQGCGTELPVQDYQGRQRKWCSGRCRKRTLYAGRCVDCGGLTDGSNGRDNAPERCLQCIHLLNVDRDARVVEAWERGEQAPEIAAREGLTPPAVMGVIEKRRRRKGEAIVLHRRQNRTLWPLIERRWREGVPVREIAAEAGTSRENIYVMSAKMREAGIDLPLRFERPPEHVRRRAVKLYAEGQSSPMVAEALGVAPVTVRTWARKAGIRIRSRSDYRKAAA